jgi:hypothetical protein
MVHILDQLDKLRLLNFVEWLITSNNPFYKKMLKLERVEGLLKQC